MSGAVKLHPLVADFQTVYNSNTNCLTFTFAPLKNLKTEISTPVHTNLGKSC